MANTIAKRVFMTRPSPAEKVSQCTHLEKMDTVLLMLSKNVFMLLAYIYAVRIY